MVTRQGNDVLDSIVITHNTCLASVDITVETTG